MAGLARLGFPSRAQQGARVSPIGLEFADDSLNLVQLERGHPPRIRACASLPYPVERNELMRSAPALKAFVKQALGAAPFSGRHIVTALPAEEVRILTVTYQTKAGESDDQAIAKLMRERVGDDLDQFVIDYVPVRTESREGDRLAMVLLSERSKVVEYLESLRRAGLQVKALEVIPIATKRLISTLIGAGELPQNVLVVNTGAHKTYLTMVSGQRLLFDQSVDFGEVAVLEEVSVALDAPQQVAREIVFRRGLDPQGGGGPAAQLGLDETSSMNAVLTIVRPHFNDLVAEVRRAVLFASSETRGGTLNHICLMGSIAQWPGAAALLSSLADMPVSIPQPLPSGDALAASGETGQRPELVVAAGLALREFVEHA